MNDTQNRVSTLETAIASQADERAKIARLTQQYMANGGTITVLNTTEQPATPAATFRWGFD